MTTDAANLLLTHSLRRHPLGQALAEVMAAALRSVDPAAAVRRTLSYDGAELLIADRRYRPAGRVIVVGAGKAGVPMARAAYDVLGERIDGGLVIVKEGHRGSELATIGPIEILEAAHPVPDERNPAAAQRLAVLLDGLSQDDLVLMLISGGGSALLTLPVPGLSLSDLQALTTALLRTGATIGELNVLRKHCTALVGGQLARRAMPASIVSLIVSDVVGSQLDVIASGPTTADPTTFADAWDVIERYDLAGALPVPLLSYLLQGVRGELPETPKPHEALWQRVDNQIISSNGIAAQAAVAAAQARGINAQLLTTFLEGEAREVGRVAAALAREVAAYHRPLPQPALLVAGGETTVVIRGDGLGGRNQELALGAVHGLAGLPTALVATLATDGGDGPTDAAGAVVTGETLARARQAGLNPADFLRRNDSYHFFDALDDLLRPGPTLTNVNDLLFILVGG